MKRGRISGPFFFVSVQRKSGGDIAPRQFAMRPDFAQRREQAVDIAIAMHGRRSDPQPLAAARHRRIIDRLHINAVIVHQPVADEFALVRVAYHHRNDVAGIGQMRNAHPVERTAHFRHAILLPLTLGAAVFQMPDAGTCARRNRRGKRGGEDKAAGKGAHIIAQVFRRSDIAAHHAKRLAQACLRSR